MMQLNTRQQGARLGRARRLVDISAQQRVLAGMGVQVARTALEGLPPGGWLRYVPEGAPLRIARLLGRS